MKKLILLLLLLPIFVHSISTDSYTLAPDKIMSEINIGNHFSQRLIIHNKKGSVIEIETDLEGIIADIAVLDTAQAKIQPDNNLTLTFNAFGDELHTDENITFPINYSGKLIIKGDIEKEIPIELLIYEEPKIKSSSLVIDLKPLGNTVTIGQHLRYVIDMQNMLSGKDFPVALNHSLLMLNKNNDTIRAIGMNITSINKTIFLDKENVTVKNSFSIPKQFSIPDNFTPGEYILLIDARYNDFSSKITSLIKFQLPFLRRKAFGLIPYWLILSIVSAAIIGFITYKIIRHEIDKRKRFKAKVDYKELPKEGARSIFVGKIAETNKKAYFDMDVLTVHSIVAGSTGGGKSIAAQDIIEECLIKGVAVVCFDPTAQWSGMLRKCTDKKMLSFYPKMSMKPKEARAFPGNIRAIKDGREVIEIYKYWKSGEIQVFTTNTLDPKDYDIFVANTIRQIFHSKLEEFRGLRFMLVYDEIHRILPKFGGSGQGFIQIERGCREFRKWGIGILLISQVLSDFVGQIKANINTNVQMKTRDESDLNRIKTNYGEEFIQALIKAPVGSGMVQNSAYNRGRPYYITFRPILHSVVRLSDEELEKYNKYNDIADDLEYQFEQLEEEGQDVFDLKLELKLARDKIKAGNFNMVQIYLDGLTPRVEKLWNKIGKKAKKLERKLVDMDAMQAELEKAKQEHDEAAEKQKQEDEKKKAEEEKKNKKEVKMDPEQTKANLESIGQLSDQVRGLIAHKDWMTINDLLMEIKNIPLPTKESKKKEDAVEELKKEMEEAKNPPEEKKDGEKKDEGKGESKD